ncbi:endoglycosidase [Dysgonomonas sp. Marseille-P4677]|uniref:glycoside hydrolase family 18 n=1 Tax=Dysgonomonas sp. Marseille-P4677 TaxID=2364790 RepID=UPI0019138A8D|nr:glycoside hydrolase family 18 [Dysgonomonas sp. Marseille-P4677]MBK5722589.1 endoglycosidase [Dysgonomonas sp. Marseille-P4677]
MRKLIKYITLALFSCCFAVSCNDWTDVEAEIIDVPGKSEEYYANLRTWKATYAERQISFGWFGGWTGVGSSMVSSLAGLPDSMDMVSIWGDWINQTEAKIKDLQYAQKVKGLKVLACSFTENVGDGFTPDGKTVKEYWGWDPSESNLNDEPTDTQKEGIRKYARAIAETINSLGYDGFDIDHEPNYGGAGDLASSRPRLKVFIEELGKYFGPKSGTGKILAVDGEPQSMHADSGPYFDWFIVQAYDCTSYTNLNSRLKTTIRNYEGVLTPQEVAKKYIVTENFEKAAYNTTGGANFLQEDGTYTKSFAGMAAWEPLVNNVRYLKGGSGVYHIEYEYSVPGKAGFYPFTREAIRLMNPKY